MIDKYSGEITKKTLPIRNNDLEARETDTIELLTFIRILKNVIYIYKYIYIYIYNFK